MREPPRRDFPGYFAGASLKLGGILRRGLVPGRDFPGYFAGASLKHRAPRAVPARKQRLPWLLRRGLIEASSARLATVTAASDFPGYFAGASLKPKHARAGSGRLR